MLVLPSPYFFASFLPPPATFWAVSPSSLNRPSPLFLFAVNTDRIRDLKNAVYIINKFSLTVNSEACEVSK